MDSILPFLYEYQLIISLVISILVTVILLKIWWDKVSFWWLNVMYGLPLIGKSRRLASDYESQTRPDDVALWLNSEATLCAEFAEHYEKFNKDDELFSKSQDYLGKVTESGRKNLHFLGWILISALVFLEAMGFSYVLSGFTIPGASESLQQQGALGIAFIISVLLVALTHYTGHELHANSLIKKARIWWRNAYMRDKNTPELVPDTRINLDKTFTDNNDPQYKQLISRISTNGEVKPRHVITAITLVAIFVIAILATYVRGQVLEKMIEDEVSLAQTSINNDDPYAELIPVILISEQSEANDKVAVDKNATTRHGGWGTFIFLAFLFVFLQIFGILIGFKTGFAGNASADARNEIGKFKSEKEFKMHFARLKNQVARVAQKRLIMLQQQMHKNADTNCQDPQVIDILNSGGQRSFLGYMNIKRAAESNYNKITSVEHLTEKMDDYASDNFDSNEKITISESCNITSEEAKNREERIKAEVIADYKKKKELETAAPKKVETDDEMRERFTKELIEERRLEEQV